MLLKCRECNTTNNINDTRSGDIICGSCGEILAQRVVDDRPEWINYKQDGKKQQKSRVEKILPLSQLLTLDKKTIYQKKVINVYYSIRSVADRLIIYEKIKDILETYITILANIKNIRIQSIEGFSASILYLICVQTGLPYTKPDFIEYFEIDTSIMTRMISKVYKIFKDYFEISENYNSNLLHRFCNELGISIKDTYKIEEQFEGIKSTFSIIPLSLIAMNIYLHNPELSLKLISEKMGVSTSAIRDRLKKHLEKKK